MPDALTPARILAHIDHRCGPGNTEARARHIEAALTRGWTPKQLGWHTTRNLAFAVDRAAIATHRLAEAAATDPPQTRPHPPPFEETPRHSPSTEERTKIKHLLGTIRTTIDARQNAEVKI